MSLVVRPFRSSDSEKSPGYLTPSDTEVILQSRSTRSQNIEHIIIVTRIEIGR